MPDDWVLTNRQRLQSIYNLLIERIQQDAHEQQFVNLDVNATRAVIMLSDTKYDVRNGECAMYQCEAPASMIVCGKESEKHAKKRLEEWNKAMGGHIDTT